MVENYSNSKYSQNMNYVSIYNKIFYHNNLNYVKLGNILWIMQKDYTYNVNKKEMTLSHLQNLGQLDLRLDTNLEDQQSVINIQQDL